MDVQCMHIQYRRSEGRSDLGDLAWMLHGHKLITIRYKNDLDSGAPRG